MKNKISILSNKFSTLSIIILLLVGCSSGNGGSSSGSGGTTATTDDTTTTASSDIARGEYNGTVSFTTVSGSSPIQIDIDNLGNVTVTSSASGSTTGSVTGTSFATSGTISFNLGTQTCTGFANIDGNGSGSRLSGTVSMASASCVNQGVTSVITLDGTFTAS